MSDVFRCVEIQLPQHDALLERFYTELMQPNFPIADELEPLEVWQQQLRGATRDSKQQAQAAKAAAAASAKSTSTVSAPVGAAHRRCTLNVLCAFASDDLNCERVLGGIVFEYYHPSNCAMITYLVISEQCRGAGLSLTLTIAAWQCMRRCSSQCGQSMPHTILVETNNPALIAADEDSIAPIARIKAFQAMGVRVLKDLPYVQPALAEGKEAARDMFLCAVVTPLTPRDEETGQVYLESKHILAFLHDFFAELNVQNYTQDADFVKMRQSLESRDKVPLIDFDLTKFKKKLRPVATSVSREQDEISQRNSAQQRSTPPQQRRATVPLSVCVIGCGLSGLHCAQLLQRSGFTVRCVESRHRLGGRIHTGRSFATRLDLGASWIHGTEGNPLYEYIEREINTDKHQMQLFANNEQSLALYDEEGKVIDDELVFETYMKFVSLLEQVKTQHAHDKDDEQIVSEYASQPHLHPYPNSRVHTSLHDALQALHKSQSPYASAREKLVMNYFFSQLESLQNASMHQLNARDYDHGTVYEGGDQIVVQGYQQIVQKLAHNVQCELGRQVVHVDYSMSRFDSSKPMSHDNKPSAVVHFAQNSDDGSPIPPFECNIVVCTLPIGVLKANNVKFTPELPSWKRDAFKHIGSGLFNKVILRFNSVFWQKHTEYIGCHFDPKLTQSKHNQAAQDDPNTAHRARTNCWFVNNFVVTGEPILVAMCSAELAEQLEQMTDAQQVEAIMSRLRVMYGEKTVTQPIDTVVTRWGRDPHSLGSYSFLGKGCTIHDFHNASLPVDATLFFAGEHTSQERFGYADGAFTSGQREAQRIIELAQPITQTQQLRQPITQTQQQSKL